MNFKFYLKKVDWKTFLVFLMYALTPAIWNLVRSKIVTGYMNESLDTLAQWNYVDTGLEMLYEGMVFPLFWWFGVSLKQNNTDEFNNKVKTSYLGIFIVYFVALFITSFFVSSFIKFLGSDQAYQQKAFFELQLWAKLPSTLFYISGTILITLKKWKEILILVVAKLSLGLILDFTFSNKNVYGHNFTGLGLSTLLNSLLVFVISIIIVINIIGWKKFFCNFYFKVDKSMWKNISYSMGDSFVRNVFYLLMVAKMINSLESDSASVYWLMNGIIWNWILLPITMSNYVQKSSIANMEGDKFQKLKMSGMFTSINYLFFAFGSLLFFAIWDPLTSFMTNHNVETMKQSKHLFLLIIWFYLFYVFSESINSSAQGQGKQYLILIQSILVNIIVYIPLFAFYKMGNLAFTLDGVAFMFGFTFFVGAIFNTIVFFFNYFIYDDSKNSINEKKVLV